MTLSLGFLGVSCGIHVCPKKNFHQGGNVIHVVYLRFVLSATSALMTQAVCSSETIIFLYFAPAVRFQPEGENIRDREASILGPASGNFLYSLGTFGSISSLPSSRAGLFLIAAEPIHNFKRRTRLMLSKRMYKENYCM